MIKVINALFLERTLRDYITRELEPYRLDNVQLNLEPPEEIPADPEERARLLTLKVPPTVVCGYPPKTVTGVYDTTKLPQAPWIAVRAHTGQSTFIDSRPFEQCTATLTLSVYDQDPARQGYQDLLNIINVLQNGFFRDRVIDEAFSLVVPIDWSLSDIDTFPYWFADMTTRWQLPLPSHIDEANLQTPHVPRDLSDLRRVRVEPVNVPNYASKY